MEVLPAHPGPAEMIAHALRIDAIGEVAQASEVVLPQGIGGADVHRDAVEAHRAATAHPLQHLERSTAPPARLQAEKILGDDLEELEVGWVLQHSGVVRRAEPHPDLEGSGHGARASGAGRIPATPSRSRYTLVRAVR